MQVDLRSGGYEIIASEDVFLFGESDDLVIKVTGTDDFELCVTLKFQTDDTGNQRIDREITPDGLVLHCCNFSASGTGLLRPAPIASAGSKEIYLMFWMYEQGIKEPKARNVKYTLFRAP